MKVFLEEKRSAGAYGRIFEFSRQKRNEILQMSLLEPRIAILDEIDSGLDIDALKVCPARAHAD